MTSYMCETDGCYLEAVIEYRWYDEDGDPYYTMRCDDHPAEVDWFESKDLFCPGGHDISDPSTARVDRLKGKCE